MSEQTRIDELALELTEGIINTLSNAAMPEPQRKARCQVMIAETLNSEREDLKLRVAGKQGDTAQFKEHSLTDAELDMFLHWDTSTADIRIDPDRTKALIKLAFENKERELDDQKKTAEAWKMCADEMRKMLEAMEFDRKYWYEKWKATTFGDNTTAVYGDVLKKRKAQDEQWGGPDHDDTHEPLDWIGFITKQCQKAKAHSNTNDSGIWAVVQSEDYRERLINIAGLAIAAAESYDRLNGIEREK